VNDGKLTYVFSGLNGAWICLDAVAVTVGLWKFVDGMKCKSRL